MVLAGRNHLLNEGPRPEGFGASKEFFTGSGDRQCSSGIQGASHGKMHAVKEPASAGCTTPTVPQVSLHESPINA